MHIRDNITPEELNRSFELILNLPDIQVTSVSIGDSLIQIWCESIFAEVYNPSTLVKCNEVRRSRTRTIRDLPISGKQVDLHLKTRQFYNPDENNYFYERFSFVEPSQQQTIRYQQSVYNSCKDSGFLRVSILENLCWKTVQTIFKTYAQRALQMRGENPPRMLGIDEFAIKKGHNDYACVLIDLEEGCVLDVLPYRDKDRLIKYFEDKGQAYCQSVQVFSCDMWSGYTTVAKTVFPNATIVIDRFHFFAHMNKALDTIRKRMRRKFPDNETLKGIKWLLLKNEDELTADQKDQLQQVFEAFPELGTAYGLKNGLRDIFESDIDREEAKTRIEQWAEKAEATGDRSIKAFLKTLNKWKEYVLNYFIDRVSNGMVEGINNKIKLIKRMAFGFRNFAHFRLRIIVNFD